MTADMHVSARSHVSFLIAPQQVHTTKHTRQVHLAFFKNKYCHYFKCRLYCAMSGESNLKAVIYRCVTRSDLMSALCMSVQLPNLSKSSREKKKPKTIVLLLSRLVNLPQDWFPWSEEPNLILMSHSYFAVFCFVDRKTKPCAWLPACLL